MHRLQLTLTRAAACAALLAPAATILTNQTLAKENPPRFERADCTTLNFTAADLGEGVECGWLSVPEARAHPLRDIRLAVVIARASSNDHAIEPVLYLHGGPGIATLDVVPRALRGKSWPLLRERHDLIFLDQRGTGRSTPAICPDFNQALAAIAAKSGSTSAKSAAQLSAAEVCRNELRAAKIDPASYSSSEIAADVEALRQVLSVPRWNIFATSFGSLPAAELMRRWPETVRAVILDSAFPPNSSNRAELITATAASFEAFQRRCEHLVACKSASSNFRRSAAEIGQRLERAPLPAKTGQIDGDAFRRALWTLMVDGSTAPYLPELLRRAEHGDDELIRKFVSVFGDQGYFGGYSHAQAWLVNCHDIFLRPSRSKLKLAIAANADLASGIDAEHQDAMCNMLQPSHASDNFYQRVDNAIPTLIMFGEFDPATPRTDALAALDFFGTATLVEVDGASHAPFYTDACTKRMAIAFLANPHAVIDQSCLATRLPFAFAGKVEFDEFASSLDQ